MSFPSAFGAQVAAVLDALTKTAVTEITKLAEEGVLVLKLEIQELQRSVRSLEEELREAREAAAAAASSGGQEERTSGVTRTDIKEDPDSWQDFPAASPGDRMSRSQSFYAEVKQEPCLKLPLEEGADSGEETRNPPVEEQSRLDWPVPPGSVLEGSGSPLQPHLQMSLMPVEQYSSSGEADILLDSLSTAAEKLSKDYAAVPSEIQVALLNPKWSVSGAFQSALPEEFKSDAEDSPPSIPPPAQSFPSSSSAFDPEDDGRHADSWRSEPPLFFCPVCRETFPSLSQIEEHKKSHSALKPYRCLDCGAFFTQKTRLETHLRVHTGERPFSCRFCGKMFNRRDNCLRHERYHGTRSHFCKECGKGFIGPVSLKRHQVIHQRRK